MTRLILIRHGKSSWDDPFGDDHARILNARGKAASQAIGQWLVQNEYLPDMVLVSDAARTVETANYILEAQPNAPQVKFMQRLYHAAPDTILEAVQRQSANTIAVIGHNPGIGMAASGLVTTAPKHPRFNDYPTCATTVIDFGGPIGPGLGRCINFIVPRDLIGAAGRDAD
tara:strand:+ start:12089 stop:12601 length:513 start_codon:yes stop_codon:yes gene_type:complete